MDEEEIKDWIERQIEANRLAREGAYQGDAERATFLDGADEALKDFCIRFGIALIRPNDHSSPTGSAAEDIRTGEARERRAS